MAVNAERWKLLVVVPWWWEIRSDQFDAMFGGERKWEPDRPEIKREIEVVNKKRKILLTMNLHNCP